MYLFAYIIIITLLYYYYIIIIALLHNILFQQHAIFSLTIQIL